MSRSTASKIGIGASGAAFVLAAVFAVSVPAFAAPDSASLTAVSAAPQTTSAGLDYRAQLEAIASTQSPEQIAAIASSGGHVEILVDSGTGRILAAVKPATAVTPFVLSPIGPGCTTTSLCMTTTTNIPYGCSGSGSLTGTWSSIIRVTPGNVSGSFDWNGLRNSFAAGVVVNLTSPVTVTRIARA